MSRSSAKRNGSADATVTSPEASLPIAWPNVSPSAPSTVIVYFVLPLDRGRMVIALPLASTRNDSGSGVIFTHEGSKRRVSIGFENWSVHGSSGAQSPQPQCARRSSIAWYV